MLSPDSQAIACLPSGRNSTYRPVQISGAGSELKPPRSKFPKDKAVIAPGDKLRMVDDRIPMENYPCQRLSGKINMRIRYGVPGNEKFSMDVEGTLVIIMEHYGFVSQLQFNPQSSTATSEPTTG
jgi:hypothetical protein